MQKEKPIDGSIDCPVCGDNYVCGMEMVEEHPICRSPKPRAICSKCGRKVGIRMVNGMTIGIFDCPRCGELD